MVVYGDILFVLNLVLDYGLLMATARIAGCPFVRLRLLAGALFGGLYALLIFVPGLEFLSAVPLRLCSGVVMLLMAFGGQRRFFHLLLVFAGVTMAVGGGVLALTAVGSATLYGGVVGTGADFLAVILAGAAGCMLLSLGFRRKGALGRRNYAQVSLALGERSTSFRALVDTGNSLTDQSNRRVIVADWQVLGELLPPEIGLERADVQSPGSGFEKLARVLGPGRVRLLSYRTVGLSDGLLLALRPDRVEINGRKRPGMLVAASAHPVSDGGEYQGLVGPDEIGGMV